MGTAKHTGRIGAVTLGVGIAVATAPGVAMAEAADSADTTALIMGASGIPTWNDADVEVIMNQFITPTHPGQTIDPVAVTTPEELWPGGLLVGPLVCLAICPGSVFGPGHSGGTAWMDAPWWKLLGVFDRTFDQSVQAGVADLEDAMAEHGNDGLLIYGYSQGAVVANVEKKRLAEQYPEGTNAPDIDFVLGGDPNQPNGGLLARFPGLYIPILDFSFNGPAPTDTRFTTTAITQQYDFLADFPLYPLNVIADANALLGFIYVHLYPFDLSLAPDASTSPAYQGTYGNNSYYFFETQDLPLFGPLRTLGVPEALIDVVEPFFRVLVDLGYDRTIPLWEPTPARLIPEPDPAKLITELVAAVGEGINNAVALPGSLSPLSSPAPVRALGAVDAAPDTADAGIAPNLSVSEPAVLPDLPASRAPVAEQNSAASTGLATQPGPAASTGPTPEPNPAESTSAADNAGPSANRARELSAMTSTLEAPEPTGRSATPRPGDRTRDVDAPGNGRTATVTADAPKAEPSMSASPADSSSTAANADGSSSIGASS